MSPTIIPPFSSSFERAIPVILRHEGGWVNNPKDPGGETNYGISMLFIKHEGFLPADLGLLNFNPGCLKLLTVTKAKDLYLQCFWNRFGYGRLTNQTVATKVFDAAVNCGVHQANLLAQRAAGVHDDGFLGPISVAAINITVPGTFLTAFVARMEAYYRAIVTVHPAEAEFLPNWLKRAADIPNFLP